MNPLWFWEVYSELPWGPYYRVGWAEWQRIPAASRPTLLRVAVSREAHVICTPYPACAARGGATKPPLRQDNMAQMSCAAPDCGFANLAKNAGLSEPVLFQTAVTRR